MLHGLLLTACLATAPALAAAADDAKEDLKNGQGQWTIASVEIDGKDSTNAFKEAKIAIEDERVTLVFANGTKVVWTLKLDATVKPRCIDFKNDKGETTEGIYELKKDELKVCVSIKGGVAERPGDFTTASESGRILWVLRRSKP